MEVGIYMKVDIYLQQIFTFTKNVFIIKLKPLQVPAGVKEVTFKILLDVYICPNV